MNPIQFTTVIGPDGVIHLSAGVELPRGEVQVKIEARSNVPVSKPRPGPGRFNVVVTYMAPDFDAPLEDMKCLFPHHVVPLRDG